MDLYLHIGMEKTATTSTQRWCADNRAALRVKGVAYSAVLGAVTHRRLCLWSLNDGREDQGFLYNSIRSPADRAAFRANLPDAFAGEVAQARADGCRAFVISNEHLHSRLTSGEEVARVRDFLAPHFSSITVVCALRPQVDVAVSLASTVSRDRFRLGQAFFDRATPETPYYNYETLVARWGAVFGGVTLLAFRRWPVLTDWLIPQLGLDRATLPPVPRINEALDIQTMALVNALAMPLFDPDGTPVPFSALYLDRLPCTERLSLGLARAQEIQSRFTLSNAALAAADPGITLADLTPDWAGYDRPANTALLDAPCGFSGQMAALVRVFNEQIQMQKLLTLTAQAERAIARTRPENARRFLAEAQAIAGLLSRAGSEATQAEAHRHTRALTVLEQEIAQIGEPPHDHL